MEALPPVDATTPYPLALVPEIPYPLPLLTPEIAVANAPGVVDVITAWSAMALATVDVFSARIAGATVVDTAWNDTPGLY
ncbi:MAG: hypothetical protein DMF55_12740 [Acidobacteria bacterium]|nr:MAG: hypothetical protein DMF55_12740 [Acidobacteriota bacterium]